jgi:hypothetical protein
MGLDKKKLKKLNIRTPVETEETEDDEEVEQGVQDEDEEDLEDTELDETEETEDDEEVEVPVPSNLKKQKQKPGLVGKKAPKVELLHEEGEANFEGQKQLIAQEVQSLHDNGIYRFRLISVLNLIATKLDNIEKKLDNLTSNEN